MNRPMILALLFVTALLADRASAQTTGPFGPAEYIRRLVLRTHVIVMHSEWAFDRPRLPAHQRCFAAAQTMMGTDAVAHALALLPRSAKRDALRAELSAVAMRFQDAVKDDGRTTDAMRLQLTRDCRAIAEKLDVVSEEVDAAQPVRDGP